MDILITDETNLTASEASRFFVYGGVFLDVAQLPEIHRTISAIRKTAGYAATDEFKFDTGKRPKGISPEAHRIAKEATMTLAMELKCQLICCLTPHQLARTTPQSNLIRFGANSVLAAFHQYLSAEDRYGIVVMDRLSDRGEYQYLTEKFTRGLVLQDKADLSLNRVPLFAATCVGSSHAASLVDVVLGSFRYCINDPKNPVAARQMMSVLVQLLHSRNGRIRGHGLILRPKSVKAFSYQQDFDDLVSQLRALTTKAETTEESETEVT